MGIISQLLHGPASYEMKAAEAQASEPETTATAVTIPATSIPVDANWPEEADFVGYLNGLHSREYAVRTVVDFIVRNIASLPFKVYRKDDHGDPMEVTQGALYELVKRPSALPGMSRYRFTQHLLEDMLMEDKWLCLLGLNDDGGYSLRRIPPGHYTLHGNAFGELQSVDINGGGIVRDKTFPLPDPRVVLDVGYISSLRFGDPVTTALKPLLSEARAMARYRANIAARGAQIPAYVFRPKEVPWASQDDYDEWVQGIRNYSLGGGGEGFMPTFKDGMEIRTVENMFKPIDMNDLEARQNINILVATAFQISPENIGFRTGTNSNIASYKEKLWNVELIPYITAFEDALNLSLPTAVGEPDCYIKANLDAKLRGTLESQYHALSTATGRPFMETNRARRLLDMPPVPGGDQLITPLNVTEGGQPSPQDGGQTQNAQNGSSPNGKTADALAIFNEFKRLRQYDADFRRQWDDMKGSSDEI
ncbi:hypothetical protein BPY_23240 [Bifidobacterium psychraerophilum]|uniref:phage portal protein n=1 Tax=Bifidobacterium psychraerophilum TaxID=218140 RepID=UPI00310DE153